MESFKSQSPNRTDRQTDSQTDATQRITTPHDTWHRHLIQVADPCLPNKVNCATLTGLREDITFHWKFRPVGFWTNFDTFGNKNIN